MKKCFLFNLLFCIFCWSIFAYNWKDVYDVFPPANRSNGKYKILKNEYIVIKNCNIFDEKGNVLDSLVKGEKIECSKFIGLHDENFPVYNRDEFAFAYNDGWVLASNLIIADSESLPSNIISNTSGKLEKLWVPIWYNEVAKSKSPIKTFNEYTEEDVFSEYHNLYDIIRNGEKIISFSNCIFDLNGIPYKMQKIFKKNNIYCIKCQIESIYQTSIRKGWSDKVFDKFPNLQDENFFLIKMEINGNRIRLYTADSNELIVELMNVTPTWISAFEDSIINDTQRKACYYINENLERKWTDPASVDFTELLEHSEQKALLPECKFKEGMLLKVNHSFLKVYTELDTMSDEIAILPRDTILKVLEISNKIAYDNLYWIKVEITSKQKDYLSGAVVPKGTTGWCIASEKLVEYGIIDTKTNVTNVAPNKTMTVKENLKLRSGEATTTQVLTVMSVGTKVKILELGKAEKINGINSNWVKVEVQKNAKDRDGKAIKAGTIGWCYGGYLE